MKFPVYRKYSNNKSFFKVLNEEEFEEIQIVGTKFLIFVQKVRIMPDRFLIDDMVKMKDGFWQEISAEEYHEIRERAARDINN